MLVLRHLVGVYSSEVEYRLVSEEVGNCQVAQLVLPLLEHLKHRRDIWVLHYLNEQLVQPLLNGSLVAVLKEVLAE